MPADKFPTPRVMHLTLTAAAVVVVAVMLAMGKTALFGLFIGAYLLGVIAVGVWFGVFLLRRQRGARRK